MALSIRLARRGRKNHPTYRIVVADTRSPRDGRFIEQLGYYQPVSDPPAVRISNERASLWLSRGARPSPTVKSLLISEGILKP